VRRERERREIERKERERGEEVEKRRERRNVVWRGVEGGSAEGRKRLIEGIVREELGRRVEIGEVRDRKGSAGTVLIVKMGKMKDRIELLERLGNKEELGVGVNEDNDGRKKSEMEIGGKGQDEEGKGEGSGDDKQEDMDR